MNFCTKCASYYQQPGTCNCYAPVVGTAPGHKPYVPQEPNPWLPDQYPTTCGTITFLNNMTPTEYAGDIMDNSCTVAYDPSVPWTYTVN